METFYCLSLVLSVLFVQLEAVPVKPTDPSPMQLESLGLRLGVLQDIATQMVESTLLFYIYVL